MDVKFLLAMISVLLMAIMVLLWIAVYRMKEGFRVLFNYLDRISSETGEISGHLTTERPRDWGDET